MERLWQNGIVRNESGMFAGKSRIDLMFPAQKILQVTLHSSGEVFEAGKDYCHAPGDDFITRTENSRIPYLPPEALRPTGEGVILHPEEGENAIDNAVDGGNLIFDGGAFFAFNQVDISYCCGNAGIKSKLAPQPEKLPGFRQKRAKREPLKITLIGDSISEGFNATKFVDVPPFAPCYMEQVVMELGENVSLRNRAIRSTGIHRVSDIEADYLGDAPDLLVIAYGMNNFAGMPVDEFISRMQILISGCQAVNPQTEYLIVSSMSGNPDWRPTVPGPDLLYAQKMREFAAAGGNHIAIADVHKIWSEFLERKDFYDLTGNGVNHPNDYGHRIYASVVLEVLTGKKYFD